MWNANDGAKFVIYIINNKFSSSTSSAPSAISKVYHLNDATINGSNWINWYCKFACESCGSRLPAISTSMALHLLSSCNVRAKNCKVREISRWCDASERQQPNKCNLDISSNFVSSSLIMFIIKTYILLFVWSSWCESSAICILELWMRNVDSE